MGRKLKIEDDIQKNLLKAIEKGLTIADACTYAGISEKTYYNRLFTIMFFIYQDLKNQRL